MADITDPALLFGRLISHAANPPYGALNHPRVTGELISTFAGINSGAWRVRGKLTVAGVNASRKVILFAYPEFIPRASTWSDAVTGEYVFDNLPASPQSTGGQWAVLGVDHTGAYDPECKVGVTVEAMP